jgi:hypothetical protein
MADELRATLQRDYPDLYQELLTRDIGGFRPDAARMQQTVDVMTRPECRACRALGAAPLICPECQVARYCDAACQQRDRAAHARVCQLDGTIRRALLNPQ